MAAFPALAIRCGLRASELRGLRWQDVDLKSELHVHQRADAYNEIGRPKSRPANAPFLARHTTLKALKEWKLKCPRAGDGAQHLVFPNGSGKVRSHANIITAD